MARKRRRPPTQRGRPSADRPLHDLGTDELRLKRIIIAGENSEYASYPLGAMLRRKLITQDQHNAGDQYATLWARFTGRFEDAGVQPNGTQEPTEETQIAVEKQYRACKAALLACGRRVADSVENAAVYRRYPRWLFAASRNEGKRKACERDRQALVTGLESLVRMLYRKQAA